MQSIKEKLPPSIRNAGKAVKSFGRYCKLTSRHNEGVKAVNRKKKDKRTMIFLVNFPQAWSSVKSVYDEAKKQEDLNVIVFAVPQYKAFEDDSINIATKYNDSYEFLKMEGIDVVKANTEDGHWIDLRKYDPDYVIYMRSYNQYTPKMYKSYTVCRYAKCFYLPYAYGMLGDKMLNIVLPENFTYTMHRIFFANESRKNAYAKEQPFYRREFVNNRLKFLGFSRFDMFKSSVAKRNYDEREYTVAWMPRWATDDKPDQKPSHFMTFYKEFLNYFYEHTDVKLIIRPHPLMFSSYISNGIMTEEEVNSFKKKCKEASNIEIDERKDYSVTLEEADLLIADYTSLIAEFYIMGKPIIYCDTADNLNEEGNKICATTYNADDFDEIVKYIELLKSGHDSKQTIRNNVIKELLPGKTGEIGKAIFEEIINS